MALHDRDVYRTMACGIAGLSVAADSLSAIKYARVKPVRDHHGLAVDFVIEGDYPQYGNNDDRVDAIACDLVERFMRKNSGAPHLASGRCRPSRSRPITSNVVYTARKPATPRTDVGRGRRSLRGPIRCMAATGKGRWRR